jgi:perosamine synthetase
VRIPLSQPVIGEREIEYVTRVLRSGKLSLGPVLAEFETRFAAHVGARYAIATNSGTSALHLCVRAFDIGPEDEVLTTSFTFAASVNCLLYERALPAFVDIDPSTLNLDPAAIRDVLARDYSWDAARRRLVNRRSGRILKAVLPVHVFGLPCAMRPILETAREFNLSVIEDACEALGAEYGGRRAGTFGDAAAFGFYPNKQITAAEGGMIVTDSPQIAKLCRCLRNQGRDEDAAWLRHSQLGYNYRLSDLHAALGLAQLEKIDALLSARERVAQLYSRALAGIPQIVLPWDPPGTKRSWFVYAIRLRLPSSGTPAETAAWRDHLMAGLRARGIACQAYFPAIHRQPYFQDLHLPPCGRLPHTEMASERCLALPFFPYMTEEQVAEVSAAVREILEEAGAISESPHPRFQEAARASS